MSNTELLSDQATQKVDDLSCSITENVIVSSDQQESALINSQSNSCCKDMSNVDSQVIESKAEADIKPSEDNDFHLIKWIDFNFEYLPILLQNVNGPCPLLAIFNILLLRKRIILDPNRDAISTERVITLLAEHILEHDQSKLSEEDRINYEHNVQDALAVLDKLKTGLDVNLKFDGVDKFEYTPECIIFDLLNIQLFHGWVIDPQDTELRTIVTTDAPSYNQLVEKMIRQRHSEREELVRESLLIEQFLDENRSQLTHYGILQLNQTMRDNQLAVFFRNNHFSTIWKNQNQLLVLVSDQGYLDHKSIVFETLTDIDNDSLFTDGYGRIWRKPEAVDSSRDRDLAIALHNEEERLFHEAQLQQQQQQQQHQTLVNSSQSTGSSLRQSKKSKNKSKRSSDDDDDKDSCTLL
ncbi:unnamed protein product [Rotaria sp. Silwood1]|nr:unnamed protein product [Rotaria sp. Silwood1]CAF3387748.1 unnamed protein product [Rotaria sp. Silwood1]CAF3412574.1 unnamed protein product [Rotaria sp. Silwood1]CAF3415789.1 unnamed protein product [Rotaria sp. Silwood1]CAF4516982.1 unnamed protein product [Rotaria sp. Silwood1]